jgi:hypothetical protein
MLDEIQTCVLTLVQAAIAFLLDNLVQALPHSLVRVLLGGDMRPRLDGEVRVGYGCGQQFPNGAEIEGIPWSDFSSSLDDFSQFLINGILYGG